MINMEKVRRHFHGREAAMKQIFEMFMEDAPPVMETLKTTVDSGEYESAARAAHDIANMAAVIRAEDAAACARQLQQTLIEKDESRTSDDFEKLASKMDEAMDCIKRLDPGGP